MNPAKRKWLARLEEAKKPEVVATVTEEKPVLKEEVVEVVAAVEPVVKVEEAAVVAPVVEETPVLAPSSKKKKA